MGILVACYGDSYGDTGSVEAWVREVVGHSATIAPSRRYHFATKQPPLSLPIGTTLPLAYPTSSVLRIPLADYQAVPASDPIMCLAGRCQGSPLRSDRCAAKILDSSLRITH